MDCGHLEKDSQYLWMDSPYLEMDPWDLDMDFGYLEMDSGYLKMESRFPRDRIGVHGDGLWALGDKSIHRRWILDSRNQDMVVRNL